MNAHEQVARAVAAGELTREPCETCGEAKTVAHHDDYSRPLKVRWLCHRHHRLWHAEHAALNRPDAGAVLIRAKLTPDEWNTIRKLAIDRRQPVSELVGDAIRERLLSGARA